MITLSTRQRALFGFSVLRHGAESFGTIWHRTRMWHMRASAAAYFTVWSADRQPPGPARRGVISGAGLGLTERRF